MITEKDLKIEFERDTGYSADGSETKRGDKFRYYKWCVEKLLEFKNKS